MNYNFLTQHFNLYVVQLEPEKNGGYPWFTPVLLDSSKSHPICGSGTVQIASTQAVVTLKKVPELFLCDLH